MSCSLSKPYQYLSNWEPSENFQQTPRIIVATAFIQKGNQVLVLQRAKKDEQYRLWGIPGGKLEYNESPIKGLIREIEEETSLKLFPQSFELLGTAISCTPCDGQYGLYIYYVKVPENICVRINQNEHSAFRWVTLDEFENMPLLTAQKEAYDIVRDKVELLINI